MRNANAYADWISDANSYTHTNCNSYRNTQCYPDRYCNS
jgi:hypothetical protein